MVEIKCKGSFEIALADMTPFQGEMKALSDRNYQKLRSEIVNHGFSSPFFIWKDPATGRNLILDGHQRYHVLHELRDDGVELPEKWPAVQVEAKDEKEARRKLVTIASQYGTVNKRGLMEFVGEEFTESDVEEIAQFDALKWAKPKFDEPGDEGDEGGEGGGGDAPPPESAPQAGKGGSYDPDDTDEPPAEGGAPVAVQGDEHRRVTCPGCGHEFEIKA